MAKTDDTQKMLQIIINEQSSFRQEVLKKFDEVEKKFLGVDQRFDSFEKNLTEKLDKLDRQLAHLLEKRKNRAEQRFFSRAA